MFIPGLPSGEHPVNQLDASRTAIASRAGARTARSLPEGRADGRRILALVSEVRARTA